MARVLVTGATGFLGSHVVRALLARGDDVRVTVRVSSPLDALDGFEVERVTADITDRAAMRRAARGVERVFHVAGTTNLRMGAESLLKTNAEGTRVVLGAICVVDVEDVAAGLLLCDERGAAGERYILGTRNYTWQRLFAELQQISGIEGPAVRLPLRVALTLAEANARAPGPTLVAASEVRAAAHWWTYRSAKARRELGWTTRPHEATVEATVRYHEERLGDRLHRNGHQQPLAWRVLGRAVREVMR